MGYNVYKYFIIYSDVLTIGKYFSPSLMVYKIIKKKFFYIYLFLRERERARAQVGEGQRERDTAGSRLQAVSPEPDAGLKLTDREIMT